MGVLVNEYDFLSVVHNCKARRQNNGKLGIKDSSLRSDGQAITITKISHVLAAIMRESHYFYF